MYVCVPCACQMPMEARRGVTEVLSCLMGTGNQTQLLWKSNKYTYLLSHLSSLFVNSFLYRGSDCEIPPPHVILSIGVVNWQPYCLCEDSCYFWEICSHSRFLDVQTIFLPPLLWCSLSFRYRNCVEDLSTIAGLTMIIWLVWIFSGSCWTPIDLSGLKTNSLEELKLTN